MGPSVGPVGNTQEYLRVEGPRASLLHPFNASCRTFRFTSPLPLTL